MKISDGHHSVKVYGARCGRYDGVSVVSTSKS